MKPELLEKRAAIVARMTEADSKDNNEDFTAAERELRDLDGKINRQKAIDSAERNAPGQPINNDQKLDTEIRSKFSLTRAVAGAAGLGVDFGFEREIQGELAKRAGRLAQGLFIPTEIFETRVQKAGVNALGGALVDTDLRADLFISALTAVSVVRGLGARTLSGLRGDVAIPKETGSPAIGWVGEDSALTSSDASFTNLMMVPNTCGALAEWSRLMLLQSSTDIEMLLRQMLARDLGLAIDTAAINGSGIAGEPLGLLNTFGIQTSAYATSLYTTSAVMMGKADTENVAASRGFLTTPAMREIIGKALTTDKLPYTVANVFHNEPVTFSNQISKTLGSGSDHGLVFGDWSQMLIGVWSEIDVLVNPFSATPFAKGNVQIRAMANVDIGVRHPKAFVSATGVTTSATAVA